MEPKPKTKAQLIREFAPEKKKFDAEAKRTFCIRCHSVKNRGYLRLTREVSTKVGVLPHTIWLCKECSNGIDQYISEIRQAEREAERPIREAEMAERRQALEAQTAEARATLNQEREAKGLPPLAPSKSSTPKSSKPKKKPAGRRKPKAAD
jgi:RNase P subunit RPR2